MKFLSLILLCIGISTFHIKSYSQNRPFFLQSHINSQNGLPQNTVRDFVFGKSGFLWIATEDGLVRFDGKNAAYYNSQNSNLPINRISQLLQTEDQRFFCLTDENQLIEIIERPPYIHLQPLETIPEKGFLKYHLFKSPTLHEFLGIFRSVQSDIQKLANQILVFALPSQHCYVQKNGHSLSILSNTFKVDRTIALSNCANYQLFVADKTICYLSDDLHFYTVDLQTGKTMQLKEKYNQIGSSNSYPKNGNENKIIWNEKTQSTYFIKHNCLFEITREGNLIHLNKLIDDLPKFAISAVAFSPDKEQLLIGTLSNGFFSYRKSSFTSFQTSLSDNIFYAQAITKQDHIITANPNLEITKTNIVPIFQSESNNKFAIYYDSIHHQIWSNNYATLNCFDLQHHVQKRQIDYTLSNLSTITLIDRRDDSSMYIGTSNSIYYYKIDSGFHKLGKFNNQATKGRAYCILKQGDSIVWIGTHRGLYKYQTQLNTFTKAQFPDFIVRTLKLTSSGLMLIGTYGNGIYALNENKFKEIALDKFSNLKTTHSFFEDAQGYLWLSSNNGLFRTKLSEITNYVSGKKTQIYYYRYSTLDGLPTNEFNGGCYPPLAVFQDTTVSLPTMNGLLWFKPSTMQTQFTCTELFIDKLVLNDSSITLNDSIIHIPKHHFKLSVFLSSPLWSDENNLLISYKIDNNDWTILRNNTAPIILQNLEGGIRHLYIRKQSGFLESDIKEMHLVIEVPKLIYEYKIFWPFLLAFGLLSVFGTYKLSSYSSRKRKQKLEKLVSEKTKELKQAVHTLEIQNVTIKESEDNLRKETELKTTLLFLLSHDIATPLRYVNMYLSDCTSPTALPIDINDLVDLKISTTNLEYLLDNIVTWVKHSIENNTQPPIVSVNLHKIIVEKLRLFDLMIQRKQNHIHNLVSTETIVPADSFIVSMAIQNILGNAIHHTKNGEIRIEYLQSDLTHQIIISDTGIGLQTPKIESPALSNDNEDRIPLSGYGIGLKIANQLLELINGYIEVKPNDKGIGTMAIIYIRKSNT